MPIQHLTTGERNIMWQGFWDWWADQIRTEILSWSDAKLAAIDAQRPAEYRQPIPITSRKRKPTKKAA
jgi:hypothetical protein